MSISRSTLRSVIRALQQAGYVQTQRGRRGGSFVIWSQADATAEESWSDDMKHRLLDALRFRSVLEPGGAALAAQTALSPRQRTILEERLAAATTDGPEFRNRDAELHGYIAHLSGCNALEEGVGNIQLMLNQSLLRVVPVMGPAVAHSHRDDRQAQAWIVARACSRAGCRSSASRSVKSSVARLPAQSRGRTDRGSPGSRYGSRRHTVSIGT